MFLLRKQQLSLNLSNITEVITHNGNAHVDDFLSCCLALALFPNLKVIKRVASNGMENFKATKQQLLLDVGSRYDQKQYFDHHQIPANKFTCTLNLFLTTIFPSFSKKDFNTFFPQLNTIGIADTNGVSFAYNYVLGSKNISISSINSLTSVIEITLLNLFSENTIYETNSNTELPIIRIMKDIGLSILKSLRDKQSFYNALRNPTSNIFKSYLIGKESIAIVLDRILSKDEIILLDDFILSNSLFSNTYKKFPIDFIISRSSQDKNKWSVIRKNKYINFKQLNHSLIEFKHNSGFMLVFKANTKIQQILEILTKIKN